MHDSRIIVSIIALLVLVTAFSHISVSTSTKIDYEVDRYRTPDRLQSLINPKRQTNEVTWLGGDAATSVETSQDRYIWLFGDTLLGKAEGGSRHFTKFIHNSVGVMEREQGGNFGRIHKYYSRNDSSVKAIFPTENEQTYYWPLVGAELEAKLLVAASKVSSTGSDGFEILGTTFFLIENPGDKPSKWNYSQKFFKKEDGITWGIAVFTKGKWLFILGEMGQGLSARTSLARIKVRMAERGKWNKLAYFTKDGWENNSDPKPITGLPGTSETTIKYNSFLGWYCVQIPAFSYDVHLYTAEQLTGPWRDRGSIYSIPEPWSNEKTDNGKHAFIAYAAKVHPELATQKNEIVLTYNVNLNPFIKDLSNKLNSYIEKPRYEGLYVPQFVSIELNKKKAE